MAIEIRTATWADEKYIGALLTLAFSNDPYVRWLFPDAYNFVKDTERYPGKIGKLAFDNGTAYVTEDLGGAALWIPPRYYNHEEPVSETTIETDFRDPDILDECAELNRKVGVYRPSEPHWFLALIAVDPAKRGLGYGSALMAHALKVCDQDKLPSYLESTNAANLSLYERSGFELLDEVQVGTQKRYPMLRQPQ